MAASSKKVFPLLGFLLFALLLPSIQSNPVKNPFGFIKNLEGCHKGQTVKGLQDLKHYLEKFGYLNYKQEANKGNKRVMKNHANDDEFDDLLESAIKTYQRRYHLKVTGGLDADTANQMMKPRCGVADINVVNNGTNRHNHHRRSIHTVGRFQFFRGSPKWPADQTHLRYRFLTDVQVPGTENLRSIISRAFQRWTQVSHFTFEEVAESSVSEIEIGFHRRQALDRNDEGFDGPLGTFAHAMLPPGGRFHYDADETWSGNPGPSELDLESVAVHEIGHLLGLRHSEDPQAIMFAYFDYGITKRDLHRDDIQRIRALYGSA
ncbi:Peptidase M10, metallopeptidase [Corchorus capsularis]|uniref:Peptidase M10, metallopeptidase n=1 Tax=Corchorus capsularis TaxID=210143 RepID=A0A1R3GXJ5_COCAP|nr:Peptidase M10, metallopeptidase [Corchorus capsularis]